ncbi:MAG: phosphotransferase [Kiritimatiellaeota bacterium]|nr:phosphotransferase [Kiritimatiellota bacterium]
MNEADIIQICAVAFELGPVHRWRRHGGTAGKTWKVVTSRGKWLLRLRGVRTSSDRLIAFDHALRRHLLDHGIPTVVPLRRRDGRSFIRIEGRACEVYPFIEGRSLSGAGAPEIAAAARSLARFHAATREFVGGSDLPPPAQYSTLGVPETSPRLEDPILLTRVYEKLAARPGAVRFESAVAATFAWLRRLREEFDDTVWGRLPRVVQHGDYTLANLLFGPNGEVCGIFDLDWACRGPRVRDVADGLFFVAGRRRSPLRPGDIRSLTEPVELDPERCALWLKCYEETAPLGPEEWEAVPLALAARWLSVRAEGMAKVPADERLDFCFGPIAAPLRQLQERWPAIRGAAHQADECGADAADSGEGDGAGGR